MTLVDSNILIDVWSNDSHWAAWSTAQLAAASDRGPIVVNPIILAELVGRFAEESDLLSVLSQAGVRRVALPIAAAWPAARAFALYQKRGGTRSATLPDFFIGAHAQVEDWPLLTRDPKRYRTYFPKVKLIAPK